jgi:hypothetical protein
VCPIIARKRKKGKLKNKRSKLKKGKSIIYISTFYSPYTVRRSRFAKRFLKTAPAPPEEP